MIRTVEAFVDEEGKVHLLEPVHLSVARRAIVTILDERPATQVSGITSLSEAALAGDWNRPEEDEAWAYLQPAR